MYEKVCVYSPCIRGCFPGSSDFIGWETVFPVHTGVFLQRPLSLLTIIRIPRAYGGVSFMYATVYDKYKYSPCIRGCFRSESLVQGRYEVFPVHTGVFLETQAG